MMKRETNLKRNTKKIVSIKTNGYLEPQIFNQYVDTNTRETVITTREWAFNLGQELKAYSLKSSSSRIPPFYLSRGIGHESWRRLVKVYQELRDSLDVALDVIGDRREKGGLGWELSHKLDAGIVSLTSHKYCSEWQEMVREKQELAKELLSARAELAKIEKATAEVGNTKYIVVPDYKDCPEVPVKKTPEEVALEARKKTGYDQGKE